MTPIAIVLLLQCCMTTVLNAFSVGVVLPSNFCWC